MPQPIIQQGLLEFGRRIGLEKRARLQCTDGGLRPGRPWRRPGFEKGFADGAGLFLLALQFQLARFQRPFLFRRGLHRSGRGARGFLQVEQRQQRMANVGFRQHQGLDRPRHADIQRVDIELVDLQRLVGLVAGPAVFQFVSRDIGRADILADFRIG